MSSNRGKEIVVVEGVIQWVTPKGVKVLFSDATVDWLPLSQIKSCSISAIDEKAVGKSAVFYVPRWLAENKGVEYIEESDMDESDDIGEEREELDFSDDSDDFDDGIPF